VAVTSFVSPEKASINCPMRKLMDKHRDAVKRGVVFSPILHVMASND
jgi:hypothetical protein